MNAWKSRVNMIERVVLLVLFASVLTACGKEFPKPLAAAKPQIAGSVVTFAADSPQLATLTVSVIAQPADGVVELNARLVWDEERTVRVYPPFAGRVIRIAARPGDVVKAGEALAIIASPDFGQAQADAGKATADFALAEKNLARVKELVDNGVAPRKDLAQAEAEHARGRSELARAQGRIRLYGGGIGIDQTLALKSPVAGTVVERNLNPGQELRTDQGGASALFVVTDPSRLWVQIDAHEQELSNLVKGAIFGVKSANYPGERFEAKLESVADFIDPQTRVIRARGSIVNLDRRLKGEMLATAEFPVKASNAVLVPARAVVFSEGRHYAFIERAKGRFERVVVAPGIERRGQLAVSSGLRGGDRVVTDGALLLQQVMRAATSKAEAE